MAVVLLRASISPSLNWNMSHPRRRSSTKETDKSLATARSTLAQENGESDHGAPPSERFALQETLRALVPELGENEVYWLPIAVARLGMRTPNLRTVGLNVYPKVGENGGDGKIDPRKALMSTWHHAAKTEEELYDLQLKQRPAFAGGLSAQEEVDDGPEKRGFGSEEGDEEDEALQELLDDLKVAGYNRHFRRAKQRKSKRYSSALEEEIAKRNEHLRLRMEQVRIGSAGGAFVKLCSHSRETYGGVINDVNLIKMMERDY